MKGAIPSVNELTMANPMATRRRDPETCGDWGLGTGRSFLMRTPGPPVSNNFPQVSHL